METVDREAIVARVRETIDIVELIGSYVELRPAGRSFKARCPFHREKTPSFTVSPDKQLFHCFGCGAGGDVFSFVMKHDGLSFPEALELLARRAGIDLPAREAPQGPDKAQLISALRAAVRFYRGQLRAASGAAAVRYLRERRLPARLLDLFYVGYAPAGGQVLLEHARQHFSREVLIEAGLIGQAEGGRLYDRFRGRVTLPILGVSGEPIGFGARALRPDVEPKYLNSPETRVYRKRGELFGLPQARPTIRRRGEVLVVEGYFDVLSLANAGWHHAVAPCGTAWTAEHTRRLLKLREGQRIVFLFDGDAAGRQAAWRALGATLPMHTEVAVALLPGGKDPDDLVRAGERATLERCLAEPLSPVAFGLTILGEDGASQQARVGRIAELLAHVGNEVVRELMLDEAAERSRLPARLLRREVTRQAAARGRWRERDGQGPEVAAAPERLSALEEAVLRQVQAEPEAAGALQEAARGVPAVGLAVRKVLAWLADRAQAGGAPEPPELVRRVRAELGGEVAIGFLLDEGQPVPDERYRADLLRRLREQALEAELESLGYEIRALEAQGAGETEAPRATRMAELLGRKQALARERQDLREPPEGPAG